jgi:hypothetical protein
MEPIILAVVVLVLGFFAIAVSLAYRFKSRELQHKERMAALERGAALPPLSDLPQARLAWRPTTFLLRGMMWLFSGIALMVFLLAMSVAGQKEMPAAERVQKATWAKSSGATEDQIRLILNDKQASTLPLGFSLIGLIPMGVGLAYLIAYRKESEIKTAS